MSTLKVNKLQKTVSGAATFTLPTADGTAGQFLKTDGSGALSWGSAPIDNTPAFYAYATTNQTPGDSTWAKITVITTKTFDTDSAYDTSTQIFTVPAGKAGKYRLNASITAAGSSVSTMYTNKIALRLNGAATNLVETTQDFRNSAMYVMTVTVDAYLDLSAGDEIEVWAFTNLTSGTLTWIHDNAAQGMRFFGQRVVT